MMNRLKQGEIFIWATGGAVTITFCILAVLIVVIVRNGLGLFWPANVATLTLRDGKNLMGEITAREKIPATGGGRIQLKIGNRDLYGLDFKWIAETEIESMAYPAETAVLERQQSGNFYGTLQSLKNGETKQTGADLWVHFARQRQVVRQRLERLEPLRKEMEVLARKLKKGARTRPDRPPGEVEPEFAALQQAYETRNQRLNQRLAAVRENTAIFADATGKTKAIALADIVRAFRPNALKPWQKAGVYLSRLWELLSGEPREANTEGGLLPAIFGTVLMVLLMSVFSLPMGVVAAIYLREYAKEGWLVRLVRIAVFNLAGVPSIVYGVFGLGFFIYGVGGGIDRLFFADRLPAPTFGTGGILWASLTLSLLTVPVVIVATEEAFAGIPKGIREGSLSLGATQFQTLLRVLLPMAMPGILTGFILAMARAAGEVAPLMITGVVKLAPALPLDGEFPYLHLDRKFMHLGFHIYDVGFQSPNVEAAKPMVYVTTLLLVLLVLIMSLAAIFLRNRMRKRFQTATF